MIFYQNENAGKSYECRIGTYENWYISPHIHEYSEIAFTKKRETCVYLDGKRFIVPENHLIYIKPNQVHEYSTESSSVLCAAVFSNDLNPLFNYLTLGKELSCPVIDFSEHLSLLEEFENVDQDDKMRACGLLNLICGIILKRGVWTSTRALAQGREGLKQIVDYISNNFRDDIKISDLSKILGYHEKYLSSTLHSLTGMNFKKFLASHRINYAKKLLVENNLPISEIALESGFSSVSSFNRVFLELTGTSPSKYKHKVLNTNNKKQN
ncbi:MAG: helix-turn-helix transcriptional regulator [Clostridia bacterium]|nr:helix-turn-helix transcriptional regulator [Clostridia bacterium]